MSRTVIPRGYSEMILSSKPSRRVSPLATICGSKLPLRSRGTSISTDPSSEHLDELLSGYEKPEDLLGEQGLFKPGDPGPPARPLCRRRLARSDQPGH